MNYLFHLWVLADFDWCANITRVVSDYRLILLRKYSKYAFVLLFFFVHVVGFIHLTFEEACEKKIALICRYD